MGIRTWYPSSNHTTSTWRTADFPYEKTLEFTRPLSDLSQGCSPRLGRQQQPCQRQMEELESSHLSKMFSGHIYKAFHTFLASFSISPTPKADHCTPYARKESCVHTCWLGAPSTASAFFPAVFHYSLLCGCGQHAIWVFKPSPFNFFWQDYCLFFTPK